MKRLVVPPLLWLVALLVIPTIVVVAQAFSVDGLKQFNLDTLRLLLKSLWISIEVTAVCLVVGYPVALFIAGCSPGWRKFLLFLVVLPFWTNVIVRTYAQIFLLRPLGLYLTMPGVIAGLAHGYLPFMILPLYVSIEKVPPRLLEAARDLGASPWRAFWSVTVPLTMPGIAAGCILVFIPVLGSFAVPELLGGANATMFGTQINLWFTAGQNRAAGSALTLILVVLTLVLTGLYTRLRKSEGLV
jgi:spermidine/putrescine transport system permease protein